MLNFIAVKNIGVIKMAQQTKLSNLDKVKAYVSYCQKYQDYYNSLERLNMGENSISQLLAWLLDTNWVNEKKYDIPENQVHREFCFKFLKLIKEKEKADNKSILQSFDDEQIKELAYGIWATQDTNNIDILLVNEQKKFVCVIENKKRAKLSNSKTGKDEERMLQIEKYCDFINGKYNDYAKKFVYLCADKSDTEKTIEERLTDVGAVPQYVKDNLIFKGAKYDEIKNEKVFWALSKLNYTVLEHDAVTLILYDILRDIYKEAFDENGILKPISEEKMHVITLNLLDFYTNKKDINSESKISGNAKIRFYKYLPEKRYERRLEILCQYVEYWEMHNGIKNLGDNLYGYSKIVDGEYIYNTCKELSNSPEWQEVEKLAESSEQLQKIIKYI